MLFLGGVKGEADSAAAGRFIGDPKAGTACMLQHRSNNAYRVLSQAAAKRKDGVPLLALGWAPGPLV